ncbi:DUF2569 family protein [Paraburkholderia metrosideri]|jgi:hypothetical protein|uniref:DUF2569 family protein n=1 Tax=Paraburkholderia metrosideri TaxID=580937 RepID=A0ABN7HU15_9BURK|nr:DUF2569 family protein [Paraburkholderia metrosideri]CAD6537257.1 hypothetical protein LMG28140_03148 [Paraburkholderia metrosideri]
MKSTPQGESPPIAGGLLFALLCVAAWAVFTAFTVREPLKLMLEWELLTVFVRPDTHGWYRTVMTLVGLDVMISGFIVTGAGWLSLLASRKAACFIAQVQAWLLTILAMRAGAYWLGGYMAGVIGIGISIPLDNLVQAALAAALGIPYFRWSRRVHQTFVNA